MKTWRIEYRDGRGEKKLPRRIEAETADEAREKFHETAPRGSYLESMSEISTAKNG